MKTKLVFFLLLLPLFACTTQTTPSLTKAEKDKIQGEVKAVADDVVEDARKEEGAEIPARASRRKSAS